MVSLRQHDLLFAPGEVVYPESDGLPMSDNTEQFDWIVVLHANLDAIRPEDFVGGNILWYPVEGRPDIRINPDVLVAVGRPKGKRGSYIQHREAGVAPKVVVEVLSPGNTPAEMVRKGFFYQQYGADEYLLVDPETQDGSAFVRNEHGNFAAIETLDGWTSPFLGVRFAREDGRLKAYRPDGTPFRSPRELEAEAIAARRGEAEARDVAVSARRGEAEARDVAVVARRGEAEAREVAVAARRGEAEALERVALLAAKLRALGIDPEALEG